MSPIDPPVAEPAQPVCKAWCGGRWDSHGDHPRGEYHVTDKTGDHCFCSRGCRDDGRPLNPPPVPPGYQVVGVSGGPGTSEPECTWVAMVPPGPVPPEGEPAGFGPAGCDRRITHTHELSDGRAVFCEGARNASADAKPAAASKAPPSVSSTLRRYVAKFLSDTRVGSDLNGIADETAAVEAERDEQRGRAERAEFALRYERDVQGQAITEVEQLRAKLEEARADQSAAHESWTRLFNDACAKATEAYRTGWADGAKATREANARACESMVVGGRAWNYEQEIAAGALFAAAKGIRALPLPVCPEGPPATKGDE